MTRVVVIGAGAAGMGAAKRLLEGGCHVTLIESSRRIGGNCFGVDVTGDDGQVWRIDAGVSDFNVSTFTEVKALIDELGFAVTPIRQDASFATTSGELVLGVKDGKLNVNPTYVQAPDDLWAQMARMRSELATLARDETPKHRSARSFFESGGYSPALTDLVYGPRAGGCFAMPDKSPLDYPIASLARFWLIHGIVGDTAANRVCIPGGMHQYPDRFAARFKEDGGQIMLGTRVIGVLRRRGKVLVRAVNERDEHLQLPADHVIFALGSVDVVPLLEDASEDERRLFLAFPYQRAELVVHTDASLMPADRSAWGSFNYVVPSADETVIRPTITFYPKHMQHMPAAAPDVFVTMNPHRAIDPAKLVMRRFFVHPVAQPETIALAREIEALQGDRGTWFCGAYLLEPWVHEPALVTGLRAAEKLLAKEKINADARAATLEKGDALFVLASAKVLELGQVCHVLEREEAQVVVSRPARIDDAQDHLILASPSDTSSGYVVYSCRITQRTETTLTLANLERAGFLPRRRAERARLKLDVEISDPASGLVMDAFTHDISPIGALCEVVEKFGGTAPDWANRVLNVVIAMPTRASPIVARANVVRVTELTGGKELIALELFDLATLDRLELEVATLRATSRQHMRAAVAIPAMLKTESEMFAAGLVDLSGGGCLLSHAGPLTQLAVGAEVDLHFVLPPHHNILGRARLIRHTQPQRAAFEFIGLPEDARARINGYVLHLFRELGGRGAR